MTAAIQVSTAKLVMDKLSYANLIKWRFGISKKLLGNKTECTGRQLHFNVLIPSGGTSEK